MTTPGEIGNKAARAETFIKKELKDLGVSQESPAYGVILENAMGAYDVMTRKELKKYIEDYLDSLPLDMLRI